MWWHTRRNQISSFGAKRTSLFKSAVVGVSSVDYWQPSCAPSAVVMLDTPCSEVVWRLLATHSIHLLPLHFPTRASPCAITFQLDSNTYCSPSTTMAARTRLNVTCVACRVYLYALIYLSESRSKICLQVQHDDVVRNSHIPHTPLCTHCPSRIAFNLRCKLHGKTANHQH